MIRRLWDITLTVANLDRAVSFYGKILGLPQKYAFNDYAGFDCGGIEIGLKTWGDMERPRQGEPGLDFLVDDIDFCYATMKKQGVHFISEPAETKWGGRCAVFTDPDGNRLQLTQVDWQTYFNTCARK